MPSDTKHLTTAQLAERWGFDPSTGKGGYSPDTLKNWRGQGKGPRYIRPGKKVLYPIAAVEEFERTHQFGSTAEEVKP